jgi:uncharacterized protein YidB (DUF937 family)
MKKRVASVVLVSAMGVGGVSSLALTPAFAATQAATSQRLTDIKNALKGLVSDGTLTQAQADKVASTLDSALPKGGPRRGGHGLLEDAAPILGMTVDQIRTAMGSTKSLADVAQTKGISKATLIDKLVAAIEAHLAADVKAGRLIQAQADERKAEIKAKVTEAVDRVGMPQRPDRGGPPPAESSNDTT